MPLTGDAKREYQRKWVAARRFEYFKDKVCALCKSTDKLELDHIDPSLKVSHNIWSWAKERREVELAKCQPLCHNCHKEKSDSAMRTQICSKGHDKNVVGRDTGGHCSECRREKDRRLRSLGKKR